MARFLIVWSVFSVRKWSAQLSWRYRPLTGYGQKAVRRVMRFPPMPLLLLAVRALCRLRLLGRVPWPQRRGDAKLPLPDGRRGPN